MQFLFERKINEVLDMKQNGFRNGMKQEILEKIKADLTPEEAQRIEEIRQYDKLTPGSVSEKIVLALDSLQRQKADCKFKIAQRMFNIQKLKASDARYNKQLITGIITDKFDDKTTMTVEEIKTQLFYNNYTAFGERRQILDILGDLRAIVGSIDLKRRVIITEEEYNDYVNQIEKDLAELGQNLFD